MSNSDINCPMPMRSRDEALGVAFQEAERIGVDGLVSWRKDKRFLKGLGVESRMKGATASFLRSTV